MKRIALSAAMAAMFLTGCEATNWEITANCEGGSASWKCSGGGKISGTFQKNSIYSAGSMDAANFSIDLGGSTVGTPSSGNVTVSLVDSSTNSVQAAQVFAWIRSGERLYFTDPTQVNVWAGANTGSADSVAYQLHQFEISGVESGTNMFSTTAEYAGVPRAVSITTFSGGGGNGGCRVGHCQEQ